MFSFFRFLDQLGEIVAVAAVGVIGVVKSSGKVELWNRYVKVNIQSTSHFIFQIQNVFCFRKGYEQWQTSFVECQFWHVAAARVTGRTRANAIHTRQQAMATFTDRSFDAGTFGEYVQAATTARAGTSDAVRDAEREYRHRAFRNRQRWYSHLVNRIASKNIDLLISKTKKSISLCKNLNRTGSTK